MSLYYYFNDLFEAVSTFWVWEDKACKNVKNGLILKGMSPPPAFQAADIKWSTAYFLDEKWSTASFSLATTVE